MKYFLFTILLIITFAGGFFTHKSVQDPIIKTKTKTKIKHVKDTLTDTVTVNKFKIKKIYRDTGKHSTDTVRDTTYILNDYFSNVIYIDTLKNDSSAFIKLIDTIQQNRIQGRKMLFKNRRSTKIIHEHKAKGIYVGTKLGLNNTGIDLMYMDENNNGFGIGMDVLLINSDKKYFYNLSYKRKLINLN
ncbi:MAG: hypothetical protein ACOC2W_01460 [bacterium]